MFEISDRNRLTRWIIVLPAAILAEQVVQIIIPVILLMGGVPGALFYIYICGPLIPIVFVLVGAYLAPSDRLKTSIVLSIVYLFYYIGLCIGLYKGLPYHFGYNVNIISWTNLTLISIGLIIGNTITFKRFGKNDSMAQTIKNNKIILIPIMMGILLLFILLPGYIYKANTSVNDKYETQEIDVNLIKEISISKPIYSLTIKDDNIRILEHSKDRFEVYNLKMGKYVNTEIILMFSSTDADWVYKQKVPSNTWIKKQDQNQIAPHDAYYTSYIAKNSHGTLLSQEKAAYVCFQKQNVVVLIENKVEGWNNQLNNVETEQAIKAIGEILKESSKS